MIHEHIVTLTARHREHGAVVDANLLTLLIIGSVDPHLIPIARPTRNRSFTKEHFEYLDQVLAIVGNVFVTPHVLAETYNLLDQVKGVQRDDVMEELLDTISSLPEHHVAANKIAALPCFFEIGVTDGALLELAQNGFLIVTVDAELVRELEERELGVLNLYRCCPIYP